MKIKFLISLFFIATNTLSAQPMHRLPLQPVDSSGYYAIELSVGVLGRAAKDFSDLRILCEGKEVSYFVKAGTSYNTVNAYRSYPFKITKKEKKSELVIETNHKKISTFDIEIKNSAATKNYSLSGSNDMKEWYGVSKGALSGGRNTHSTSEIKKIDFPLSDYRYYRMVINDSLSEPLNILKVGARIFENTLCQQEIEIPQLEMKTVTEKDKNNTLFIRFPHPYHLSRIQLFISSPTYFSRNCDLGTLTNDKQSLTCDRITDTLKLNFYHGDDQPLRIDSVKCYTPSVSLVAHLDCAKSYTLTFGEPQKLAPNYDLSFKMHVPNEVTTITTDDHAIQTTIKEAQKNDIVALFWKYGIWVVILLVILQLLLIVKRKLKEID